MVRDEDGRIGSIGEIEGCKSVTLPPERKRGPLVSNLDVQDIDGAKSGSKGLGPFAFHVCRLLITFAAKIAISRNE